MPRKHPPLLVRGPFSGRIYVVTRYKVLDEAEGRIEAIEKYDVTEQFDELVRSSAEKGDSST